MHVILPNEVFTGLKGTRYVRCLDMPFGSKRLYLTNQQINNLDKKQVWLYLKIEQDKIHFAPDCCDSKEKKEAWLEEERITDTYTYVSFLMSDNPHKIEMFQIINRITDDNITEYADCFQRRFDESFSSEAQREVSEKISELVKGLNDDHLKYLFNPESLLIDT